MQGYGKISINHGIDQVGRVLDAQHVTNEIDGKNIEQVEFIGTVDSKTYAMVENNEFAGCSTEDYARDKQCDNTCKITGRAFLGNSLITKDKKPNSLHTHVSVITEADIPNIIKNELVEEKPKEPADDIKEADTVKDMTNNQIADMLKVIDKKLSDMQIPKKEIKQESESEKLDKEIDALEKQLNTEYNIVLTNDQHAKYLDIKTRLDAKRKLRLKIKP